MDEVWSLPSSVKEIVPQRHAAHLVCDILAEALGLSAIPAAYMETCDYPSYHQAKMVAVLSMSVAEAFTRRGGLRGPARIDRRVADIDFHDVVVGASGEGDRTAHSSRPSARLRPA